VEQLDLSAFERGYGEEGHPAYHPALMLKVWLYAYALGLHSSRRLEQRIREDLAFRYLAGGAMPDYWALNEFRKRHGRAVNEVFTQVVEMARSLGLGKLGQVAIDSTTVAANASMGRMETEARLRAERAKIRRKIRSWQQQCDAEGPNEAPGTALAQEEMKRFDERLAEIPLSRTGESCCRVHARSPGLQPDADVELPSAGVAPNRGATKLMARRR